MAGLDLALLSTWIRSNKSARSPKQSRIARLTAARTVHKRIGRKNRLIETTAEPRNLQTDRVTCFRWLILALVFFATTVNYLDRQVITILASTLQKLYAINDQQYGYINSSFALCYAFGQSIAGRWLDWIGIRKGYAFALLAWSLCSIAHVLPRGAWGFVVARGLLGIAESPNFPAATKTLSEWFPRRERAFAFGFVNAGTNMGAILAPAVVPWLASNYGWQWAFVGTGAVGLLWLVLWLPLYRHPEEHPSVSSSELALIRSDPPELSIKVPWRKLLQYSQVWAFALGKFLTDSMWWFFMTWIPKFLNKEHGLNLLQLGLPLVVIYVMSDLGSISGGWLSSIMIKTGATVNRSRKTALFICALAVLPVIFVQQAKDLWTAVFILGLATAAHQGFSTNLYTLVSDMFPKNSVASVAGLGGTFGYFGASLFQLFVGHMVETQKNYFIPFACAGSAYLLAFAIIHALSPKLQHVSLQKES
jgi:ACS family hexuronate transporter-like MFS transporter